MTLTPTTEEIYYASDWAERRSLEEEYQEWFDGDALRDQTTGAQDENGEKQKRYPLAVNSAKVYCEIHRDVMFGMPQTYDTPPVGMAFLSENKDAAEQIQAIYDRIAKDSQLSALQTEAGLMMQIRGGHAFQVVWEPQNPYLKYGIRIVARKSSTLYPIYDQTDLWHLQECYVGYKIDAEEARKRYFVKAEGVGGEVVYLEHWTRDKYEIRVGNEIAKKKVGNELVPMQGTHDFGCVPIWYAPHHRSDDFYGYSHVADLIGLMKEENDRLTDGGDAVQALTHPTLIGRNISESIKITPLHDFKKRVVGFFYNLGVKKNFTNSGEPELAYVEPPNIGDAGDKINEALRKKMNFVTRVTGAAIGEQDMSSGRVSGTVMGANQWPTIAHTTNAKRMVWAALNKLSVVKFINRVECWWVAAPMATIKQFLDAGEFVLVEVDFDPDPDRDQHWVRLPDIGGTIMDPWTGDICQITKYRGKDVNECIRGVAYYKRVN